MVWVNYLDSTADFFLASLARRHPLWLSNTKEGFEADGDVVDDPINMVKDMSL